MALLRLYVYFHSPRLCSVLPTSMAHRAASPSMLPPSSRARKRQRQKTNQQKRALDHDALVILHEHPTFANALRAWLAHTRDFLSSQEHRSAFKFARALRTFSSKGAAQPDYPETEKLSVDMLVQWVEDLAWSLNVDLTMKEDAGKLKCPTSRIGINYRSFIHFLARENIFGHRDVNYLLESCKSLEDDLNRTAKVNRIMEQYTWHIQETYFDVGHIVDQSFWGEYEVERIRKRREVLLRKYDGDAAEDNDSENAPSTSYLTRLPTPLTEIIRTGDIFTLQICHLEDKNIWVPYMYSGFTPTREDCGGETPREISREPSRTPTTPADLIKGKRYGSNPDALATLSQKLARVQVATITPSQRDRWRGRTGSGVNEHRLSGDEPDQDSSSSDEFDEESFTEDFFRTWEGDIDSDEDIGELLSTDGQFTDFYKTLKERHL